MSAFLSPLNFYPNCNGPQMKSFLTKPSRVVYFSVLLQLRTSIDELETPLDADTFQGFPVSEKWEAFWSLLQERWALMEEYMERDKASVMSACDMFCDWGKIRVPALLRLPGIQVLLQSMSKTRLAPGGHRETCSWKPDDITTVSPRDRSFLRALLHEDYLRLRARLLHDELVYLRSSPGSHFYYKFDYCTPYTGCEASVETVHEFALDNDIWRHQNARARASGGRVQTHVMRVADGGTGVEILATEATVADEAAQEQANRVHIKRLAELDILEVIQTFYPPPSTDSEARSQSMPEAFTVLFPYVYVLSAFESELQTKWPLSILSKRICLCPVFFSRTLNCLYGGVVGLIMHSVGGPQNLFVLEMQLRDSHTILKDVVVHFRIDRVVYHADDEMFVLCSYLRLFMDGPPDLRSSCGASFVRNHRNPVVFRAISEIPNYWTGMMCQSGAKANLVRGKRMVPATYILGVETGLP
ncbi:hypothetical protein B0H13DRAFT_1856279 [Mycena leptocephala]|nr:hypothetical protein B0H13DRAFT_1856279 [Mycena leptocephala]